MRGIRELIERFHSAPLIVFWESTKACPLACKHCRADAILRPLPGELNTEEGKRLIEQVASFGDPKPLLVITGGDPLMRNDLFDLVDYAVQLGVPTSLAPAVSPNLSPETLKAIREHGVKAISISLDGAREETHDEIRGVPGSFRNTLAAIKAAVDAGVQVQVNTVVWRKSLPELPEVVKLITDLGVKTWEVFFLIVTGRAREELDISPEEYEAAVQFLVDVSTYGIQVRTVEAPFYRRAKLERLEGKTYDSPLYRKLVERLGELMGPPRRGVDPTVVPTRDGFGIIFVAYDGTVYPSGFLPYPLGNVRRRSLVEIYRDHPLLQKMRRGEFGGRCGVCKYKDICGGSRARAFAYFKDPLAEDPACVYKP
ncbi:TIGR04053 family radical SAM/SPASM domain-containing protein [Pyrobaculum neutrophilum]|uniref:Radical SAM domain protein n=1 Tax=Pyrobaculum neutrophilum (strain DSM 2338 / JCM 9278 / NBRC 100436 / V24Sta) TaxID=444157 RepID=B1YBL4_PYRNV|nr:TIGR04053 family radical SAM/SPASM domain-containing protein [Pyrobaculum neutrophilum]ACB40816.1 Radical SAM domain protein [Pyrobaculum neutrophilum V24Sta]